MRVLKLCTFPEGGATIAARRQKEALMKSGHHCDLACIHDDWRTAAIELLSNDSEIQIKVPENPWSYNKRVTTAYCNDNRSELSNTWFSFWQAESFLDKTLLNLCLQYDVIHLHWIAGMVSSRLLTNLAAHKKRLFVTGHDMNHFTGGCHYAAGCEQFTTGCLACAQLVTDPLQLVAGCHQYKAMALGAIPASNWIFPSIWLAEEFKRSLLCRDNESPNVLYNCIDTARFVYLEPSARLTVRNSLGFANDEIVLLAGAANNAEKRKGFSYIEHAIQQLQHYLEQKNDQRTPCLIVTFGRGKPWIKTRSPYVRHQHLGSVNELKVIGLFQAADLLLFPSIEENFSNTILESVMCGCPVLAFNIGGVPDIVAHQQNGVIAESVSTQSFSSALCQLADHDSITSLRRSTELWRDQQASRYSYKQIAKTLISVYEQPIAAIRPKVISIPTRTPEYIYPVIFGEVAARDISNHEMLFANLAKAVQKPERDSVHDQKNKKMEAIYFGFGPEAHPPLGRVSWIRQKSFVFFNARQGSIPALCIRLSNIEWVKTIATEALKDLTAKCNGTAASVRLLETECIKSAFVWILPERESLLFDSCNTISLTFGKSSIPEAKDPRGLCLLHNHIGLFDFDAFDTETQRHLLADWHASNQLLIGADQSHYVHSQWQSGKNDYTLVSNMLESWIDVMQAFNQRARRPI